LTVLFANNTNQTVFLKFMTNQEINHRIATDVNGWIAGDDNWYTTQSGFSTPLPDYCNSISHALDLARASNISMQPLPDGWRAISMDDPAIATNDAVLATAISVTALAIFDSK
jgi:hypothetical protein